MIKSQGISQGERLERVRPSISSPQESLGRGVLRRAQHGGCVIFLRRAVQQTGRLGGTQVDDFRLAVFRDQDVVRAQVLVHDFQPVEGLQAARDLFDFQVC